VTRLVRATLVALAATVLLPPAPAPAVAAAAPAYRAGVVIDTGTEVKRVCIRFDAEEISGTEALALAGAEPRYQEFGGTLGSFVCQLCGHPEPVGACPNPSGDYWAYHRAEGGAGAFTTSSLGASSTRVGDGDVEGWAWGRGGAPPFADLDTICGEIAVPTTAAPPTTVPTTTAPTTVPPSPAPRAGAVSAPPGPATTSIGPALTTSSAGSPTTVARRDAPSDATDLAASGRTGESGSDKEGGTPAALAGVGALAAGLLGWSWRARRRRRSPIRT